MKKSLDKHWKTLLFSSSGFGPNLLMVIMGAYFTDAINPAAIGSDSLQVINGTCLVLPALFPILWMFAKIFDGVIDVPLAALTDSMSTKWGKRRPTILASWIPMIISFIMCWIPVGNEAVYTIWVTVWAIIFFASYTLCMISYYGSFSFVCESEEQRTKLSSYKAFFDTISYCFAYALVPVALSALNMHIDKFVLFASPVMITMLIPLFLIKEGEKYGYPERANVETEERHSMLQSFKVTFGNRIFRRWLLVNCCSFFGLQMFLVAMNAMIIGGMGFTNTDMAIINTCAFAPVPIMLYIFNKITAKKGIRFGLQICMITFSIAILSFLFGSLYITGGNKSLQYMISITGSICGSLSIGTFFMLPYVIPVQVAAVEEKLTGRNNSAMYFAVQALTTTVVGAIASSGIYENIKMLFIDKPTGAITYALDATSAAETLGVAESGIYNLGTLIVPIVVCVMCLIGFIAAFKLPRDFSSEEIAKEFKKDNPDVDISLAVEDKREDRDSVGVNIALWLLSLGLFGFIWSYFAIAKANKQSGGKLTFLKWLACTIIPFAGIFVLSSLRRKLEPVATEKGKKLAPTALYAIFAFLFPIAPLNFIGLSLLTSDTEKL